MSDRTAGLLPPPTETRYDRLYDDQTASSIVVNQSDGTMTLACSFDRPLLAAFIRHELNQRLV